MSNFAIGFNFSHRFKVLRLQVFTCINKKKWLWYEFCFIHKITNNLTNNSFCILRNNIIVLTVTSVYTVLIRGNFYKEERTWFSEILVRKIPGRDVCIFVYKSLNHVILLSPRRKLYFSPQMHVPCYHFHQFSKWIHILFSEEQFKKI